MNSKEEARFRKVLEDRRAELQASLTGRDNSAVDSPSDMFDQIQAASERDLAISQLERESSRLREVRGALGRLDAGKYGICVECDEEISPKRLAAVPWTTSCITCLEAAERAQQFAESEHEESPLNAD